MQIPCQSDMCCMLSALAGVCVFEGEFEFVSKSVFILTLDLPYFSFFYFFFI